MLFKNDNATNLAVAVSTGSFPRNLVQNLPSTVNRIRTDKKLQHPLLNKSLYHQNSEVRTYKWYLNKPCVALSSNKAVWEHKART